MSIIVRCLACTYFWCATGKTYYGFLKICLTVLKADRYERVFIYIIYSYIYYYYYYYCIYLYINYNIHTSNIEKNKHKNY